MNVLIVEDERIVARDLSRILGKMGYRVQAMVKSVREALQVLDAGRPDVVLIDIVLKGERDGVDLARTVRDEYGLPFLFVTSHADHATMERAKATRPSGYLVKPFTQEEVYAALEIALLNFADRRAGEVARPSLTVADKNLPPARLRKVKTYVEQHLDEELALADLAEVAGMSKYYFSRLFKESTGLPPYQFVIRQRVEAAKRLLDTTEQTVTEIAMQTGFSSQPHFSRTFREHVGAAPTTFREQR